MPPSRQKQPPVPSFRTRVTAVLSALVPTRGAMAYVFVAAMPVLVGVGVGVELGGGWGMVAAGAGSFAVGWLLGAE